MIFVGILSWVFYLRRWLRLTWLPNQVEKLEIDRHETTSKSQQRKIEASTAWYQKWFWFCLQETHKTSISSKTVEFLLTSLMSFVCQLAWCCQRQELVSYRSANITKKCEANLTFEKMSKNIFIKFQSLWLFQVECCQICCRRPRAHQTDHSILSALSTTIKEFDWKYWQN